MNSDVTLRESLKQFHEKNEKYFSKKTHSNMAKEFLECHDAAHVVFGCDTSLYGEGVVKIWIFFGTTLSFRKALNGYRNAMAFDLFSLYSASHVLKNIFRYLLVVPKVLYRTQQMNKAWPFNYYQTYLDQSITEIRQEFKIQAV